MKTKLLFICSANLNRSPAGERLYAHSPAYEARSCGTSQLAVQEVNEELLAWADIIICMEEHHREFLQHYFEVARHKRILVLDIPDVYDSDDPQLINLLRKKLGHLLPE